MSQVAERWLRERIALTRTPEGLITATTRVRLYVGPCLGHKLIGKLTREAAWALRRWLEGHERALSQQSVHWLEEDAAASMLAWPHSGFSAYVGPAIAAEDRAAVLRVARYGARAPVAESRLSYDAGRAEVELVSDAADGPYAGVHRMAAVEFLARLVDHILGKGEVRVRYSGAYASRRRGWWRRRGVVLAGAGQEEAARSEREAEPWPALQARRRRWAELLRLVFQVDVTVCPRCGGEMRILAFVTEHAGITRILAHLERRGVDARAGPWAAVG